MTRIAIVLLLASSLAACSGVTISENTRKNDTSEDTGSFLTGKDTQGVVISDIGSPKSNTGSSLPVNALLWRASLDIASFVPLADVDTFGGSILTEWYSLPSRPDERIKLAIFVLDRELRSDAIRVLVYIQRNDGVSWIDAGQDSEMGLRLEELILTRAREIRASAQVESEE
ncbi:MAG: DUF3576 domain-containing protein [Candidatus Puniceispirillaceae bacterium]